MYIIKTLKEFVYVDEDGRDQGQNGQWTNYLQSDSSDYRFVNMTVRQKAKDITSLLLDDARLREARKTRANMRERLAGGQDVTVPDEFLNQPRRSKTTSPRPDRRRQGGSSREDEDMRRAIEESKRMAENDSGRPRRTDNSDKDLEEALRLSKEEDESRRRTTESNSALFDEERCVLSSLSRSLTS